MKLGERFDPGERRKMRLARQAGVRHAILSVRETLATLDPAEYANALQKINAQCAAEGLDILGVESRPVPAEKIKLGLPGRDNRNSQRVEHFARQQSRSLPTECFGEDTLKNRNKCFWTKAFILALLAFPSLMAGAALPGSGKVDIYVIPFSHLDRFWAGTGKECLARGNRVIAKAIQIAEAHPRFRFFLESNNFVNNFVQSHQGTPELAEFKQLVQEGRIEVAAEWDGIFQEFPPGEVLARNVLYGEMYARKEFGVTPHVDALTDIPGFTPQFPQLLREAGIPFMIMTRMGPRDHSLFDWEARDGSKVLVWNDIYGYCWGAQLDFPDILSGKKLQSLEGQIARVHSTAPWPLFMSSGCDLWAPTSRLLTNLKALNQRLPGDHFVVATPETFFGKVADTSGLTTFQGEIPSGWPMVETSIVQLWQWAVPATTTLLDAEEFAALNDALGYAAYPQSAFDFLWKRLITSMDHNHDGQGGHVGDMEKKHDSQLALLGGRDILDSMLRNIAERVQIPIAGSVPIVVFNPNGWTRDDLVKTHLTLFGNVVPGHISGFKKGLRLVDAQGRPVPFQVLQYSENISRALWLIFVARGVSSLGYKTYYLEPSASPESFPAASRVTLDQDQDRKEPRRPLGSNVMENRFYRVSVDRATGEVSVFDRALHRYVTQGMEIAAEEERGGNNVSPELLTGRTLYASVNRVRLKENNPVRTVMTVDEQIADIPILERLTLYRNLKRLDIAIQVRWKRDRLMNIQQWIPLEQAHPKFEYGVAFGANGSNNVIPGAEPSTGDEIQKSLWEKYREAHGWIFAGTPEWGVTVAADHPIFELGRQMLRADLIRGQRYTSVKIVRGQKVTSVKYPALGTYWFHYSLSSGAGDWRAQRSYELGKDLTNPLLPVEVVDNVSAKSLPPEQSFFSVESPDVVLSALKKAESGNSIIARLYEVAGKQATTPVVFLGKPRSFQATNLMEENTGAHATQVLRLRPYEIQTIRLKP